MNNQLLFVAIVVLGLAAGVYSHSYVTSPITRSNQARTTTGCRGPNCLGPCDVPLSKKTRAPINAARGSTITVKWPRNNHAGGFIRFAWAPTSQSDSHTAFDTNVQQINCHEVGGCTPDNANDPNGGDSGPADGSSRACTSVIAVPLDLTDGEWTLQWAWFGGVYSLGDYYSCIDYKISGGPSGTHTPVFIGGDYTYPNQQKCKYFNTDRLHRCVNEPCANPGPVYSAGKERSGPPAFIQENYTPPTTPTAPTTPPAVVTTAARTTGIRRAVTTGRNGGSPTPASTTGRRATTPVTPPPTVPPTTPPTTPPATPNNTNTNSCSGSENRCVGESQYQTCFNGVYAVAQNCQSGLVCKLSVSTGRAYCVRPGESVREDANSGTQMNRFLSIFVAAAVFLICFAI